jgi:hypothetical protein
VTCDRCYQPADQGAHGLGLCPLERRRAVTAIRPDDVPGGFTVENAWREPRTFYSQSSYEQALAADGMELRPRWVPGSKHLTNWATVDAQTLENGRILAERQATTRATGERVTLDTLVQTVRVLEGNFTVRAEA